MFEDDREYFDCPVCEQSVRQDAKKCPYCGVVFFEGEPR